LSLDRPPRPSLRFGALVSSLALEKASGLRWNADAPPYLSLLRPDGESLLLLLYPDGADDVCPSLKYVDLWLALMPRLMADVRETFRMKLRDCHRGCLVQHLAHALAADNDEAAI
jgi:hypothetical protein